METMTEKEAMEIIDSWRDLYKPKKAQEALEMAITALKEVQQYREIGTVEECREAREKQTPNKPKDGLYGHGYFACGSCKNPLDGDESYCPQCGQAIRWEN